MKTMTRNEVNAKAKIQNTSVFLIVNAEGAIKTEHRSLKVAQKTFASYTNPKNGWTGFTGAEIVEIVG